MTPTGTPLLADLRHQLLDRPIPIPNPAPPPTSPTPKLSEPSPNMTTKEPKSAVIYTGPGTQPKRVSCRALCRSGGGLFVPSVVAAVTGYGAGCDGRRREEVWSDGGGAGRAGGGAGGL